MRINFQNIKSSFPLPLYDGDENNEGEADIIGELDGGKDAEGVNIKGNSDKVGEDDRVVSEAKGSRCETIIGGEIGEYG